jgi:DivIVA domain-containing protein
MDLTPQTLHAVEFREARRGGYNTRDVDDFLERVAAGVGHLHERVRDLAARAEAAEGRLVEAQQQLDEAHRRPMAPPAPAARVSPVQEADDTLRRTLVLAQRTADATIKEAKQEANRLLEEARTEASRTRATAESEARRGAEAARAAIAAELDDLVDRRDAVRTDLDTLNHHLDDQRERVRAGIDDLRRILDDGRLTPEAVPPLAAVEPAPAPPPLPSRDRFSSLTGSPAPNPFPPEREDPSAEPPPSFVPAPEPEDTRAGLIQEPPPGQPAPPESGTPPTQPMPFTEPGDTRPGDTRSGVAASTERAAWLPSELRSSPGSEPPATANGTDAADDHETRPSEWGRPVFDPES